MAPHGKELSEDLKRRIVALHENGQGYKKIDNTLKLRCSTVAKIIQRFKRAGSTQNRPRVGCPKKLSARTERHIQMLSLKNRHRSAVSIAAEIEEVGGQPVSAQTIRRTLHQIGVHGCHPRRKPLLKTIHKKSRKQFAEDMSTKHMSYDLMRWKLICLVPMASSMCGGDQTRSTKISVSCLQSSMVVGMSWSRAAWVLQVLESYISLKETWTPTYTVKYCGRAWSPLQKLGRRAVFQHDNDPKHTSKTTTALLKMLKVKVMDWPSMSPDLNPIEHRWGILKRKVEVSKVSNIRQLRDVVIEDWKSDPVATCEALVNSMPRRVKAVLDNDGSHTKYWQLTWCMLILTIFPKGCTHFCWQGFSF